MLTRFISSTTAAPKLVRPVSEDAWQPNPAGSSPFQVSSIGRLASADRIRGVARGNFLLVLRWVRGSWPPVFMA
jgi:hypothetical protein